MSFSLNIDRCYIHSVLTKGAFHRVMSNQMGADIFDRKPSIPIPTFSLIAVVSQKKHTFFFGAVTYNIFTTIP